MSACSKSSALIVVSASIHDPTVGRQSARKALDLHDVGAEHGALVGEVQHRAVVRMRDPQIGHRHALAAERDGVAIGVGDGRRMHVAHRAARDLAAADHVIAVVVEHREAFGVGARGLTALDEAVLVHVHLHGVSRERRIAGRRRERRQHVAVADELRGVREHHTARRVVPVAMGVEDVADRHLEPRRDLAFQPAREVAVDRIAHDDALGRHQEHGVVVVVLRAIQLTGHVDDAALRRLLRATRAWQSRRVSTGEDEASDKSHGSDLRSAGIVDHRHGIRSPGGDKSGTMIRSHFARIAAVALCIGLGLTAAAQTPRAPSISQDDLRTWLTYLASDELQGRQAYTEGLGLAGAYIAEHLKEWGVKPGGDKGSYFQEVRVLGVRTRSNSSVTVTVNGQSRTFKDGEGVTFPRNQGAKQMVNGEAAFAGYGVTFAPLQQDDYARRNVSGKVAIFLGRTGPKGLTNAHTRLLGARARLATETQRAVASITQAARELRRRQPRPGRPRSAWTSRPRSGSTRASRRRSPPATTSSPSCSARRARTTRR